MIETGPNAFERWRSEMTAAWLSRAVAEAESDAAKQAVFEKMAQAAEEQAAIIADELGAAAARYRPPFRARAIRFLVHVFGPRAAVPILTAAKVRGVSIYRAGTPLGHPMPLSVEEVGRRHRGTGGGALRAAVFGVNDGLVSNTCLVMGVAGAASEPGVIVLAGSAGLLAGASSMAGGGATSCPHLDSGPAPRDALNLPRGAVAGVDVRTPELGARKMPAAEDVRR